MKKFIKSNPPRFVFVVGLILVFLMLITAGVLAYLAKNNQGVLATVNGKNLTINDYKEMLFAKTGKGTPENPTGLDDYVKEPVLNDLVKLEVLRTEAARLGVALTDKEIEDQAVQDYPEYKASSNTAKNAFKKAAELSVLETKVKEKVVSYKEGNFIACRYDRYLQDDYTGRDTEGQALVDKQKPYAINYCNALKQRMEAGGDFNAELEKIKADKTIGNDAWVPFTMTLGREFGKDNFTADQFILGSDLFTKVQDLKTAAGTTLLEVNSYKDANDSNSGTSGMMVVVKLSGKGNNGETYDYEKWLQDKMGSNVKTYPERIKI